MIPAKVYFTDLEISPASLANRWHRGVIPLEWRRYRFASPRNFQFPLNNINRWLLKNIDGRWSIWIRTVKNEWEINIAFERNADAMTFILSDGKSEALKVE